MEYEQQFRISRALVSLRRLGSPAVYFELSDTDDLTKNMIRGKQMFLKTLVLCLCISEITSFKLQSLIEMIVLDQASVLHNGRTMAEVRAGNNSLDFCKLSVV